MQLASRGAILVLAISAYVWIAGCAPRSARPDVVVVPMAGNTSIARVLDYVEQVMNLAPAAQITARESVSQQFQLAQFPEDRMRLALLDSLLPKPARNDAEAVALLTGYNWDKAGSGFKGLAGALLQMLHDRQTNDKNYTLLEQQLSTERAQKERLQQQLDALKTIERTMNRRDKLVVPPPAHTTSAPAQTPPPDRGWLSW